MAEGTQLTNNVTSGVAWSVAEKIGSALLQAVVSIVVANAIMPMDMGIMAVLTVFTTLAQVVVDSGFSQTLIRKAAPTAEEYRAVFRFNILSSLILYALLTILSPIVSRYYGWPMLATVAPVLFLLLPLNALCVIQNTIMVREFRFAQLSTITFASSLISGIIAIVMALTGFGIWSLVGQRVSMMAAKAAMLWWKSSWRPRSATRASSLREMAPYSLRLMTTDIINALYNNIAQLFIGKMHSTTMLGYYSQAQKLKDLPVTSTVQAVQGVTYPALSKLSDDEVRFTEGYRRILMLTAYLIFPVMAGLIAVAPDMFMLLLGEKWMPTVPYFEILALAGLAYPLSVVSYNILKVRSDGRIILRLEVVKRVIMTLILLYTIPRGVESVAWGTSAMALIDFVVNAAAAMRYTSLSLFSLLRALVMPLLLSALLYLGVVYINASLASMLLPLRFALSIVAGVVIYALGSLIFRPEAFGESVKLMRNFLKR